MTSFGAVLCDLDGVLRHFDRAAQAEIEARYPLPLRRTAFDPELLGPAVLGRITERDWIESVITRLGGDALARQAVTEYFAVPFAVDPDVRALLAEARRRMPLVLVTNAVGTLREHLEQVGLTGFADAVISSAEVGVAKPDRRIYELAAAAAGVPAERCLFVDDRLENVEAARRLGMTGVHFRSVADLAEVLPGRSQ